MALASGAKLGPYEIGKPLGAGGMGEVYRAWDPRLQREVAVKVLPASLIADAGRMQRFEQEARAAAALNHPNLLAVFDVGEHNGAPYIVSELLEGCTLRERLRSGALPSRKAIDYALQLARGLAAAHDRGIVHRDLKPENIYITNDGRVKILDFGLAKLTQREVADETLTRSAVSDPGTVLGTVGYMSPEQVRGLQADARSDLFSYGAVLYEMLSGNRAFKGETPADTMSSILKDEPPDLAETNRNIPPALERIVRHCLEKNPAERFHSAHDVAFDLELITGTTSTTKAVRARQPRRFPLTAVLAALLACAVIAALYFALRGAGRQQARFQRINFRRETIGTARFAPDGTVLYSSITADKPSSVTAMRPGSPESRDLGLNAELASVSSGGELAVILNPRAFAFTREGTLARIPMMGGTPREVATSVWFADWRPGTEELAIIRATPAKVALEYPIGKSIHESQFEYGWVSHVRFSPDGRKIAVLDHIESGDDGDAVILDLAGKEVARAKGFDTVEGLAWSPDSKEVFFGGTRAGAARSIWSLDLKGNVRERLTAPGSLMVLDVDKDGRMLVVNDDARLEARFGDLQTGKETDLDWLDWSLTIDVSQDGKYVLISETGEATGGKYGLYLRKTDGSPAVRIADASFGRISPDDHWIIVQAPTSDSLMLYPVGAGEPRKLTKDGRHYAPRMAWFPDNKHIVYTAWPADKPASTRVYVMDIITGEERAITPEGLAFLILSPDASKALVFDKAFNTRIYSIGGQLIGDAKALDADPFGYIAWTKMSPPIVIANRDVPLKLQLYDPVTGQIKPWRDLVPSEKAGVTTIVEQAVHLTPDARFYAYSYTRVLSTLYVVNGVR